MSVFWSFVTDQHVAGAATLIGTIVGILGLAAAVFFYRKTKVYKFIKYVSRGYFIAGKRNISLPQNLEFFFEGIRVERVVKTIIHVWNGGNATINGSCLSSVEPLKIKLEDEGAIILSSDVFYETRCSVQASQMYRTDKKNEIQVSFDFIDKNDGFSIEIIHTGNSVKAIVCGTIKGQTSDIKLVNFANIYFKKDIYMFGFSISGNKFMCVTGIFYCMLGIAMCFFEASKVESLRDGLFRIVQPLGITCMGLVVILLSVYRWGIPKSFLIADAER